MENDHGVMIIRPMRAGSTTSGGGAINPTTITSYKGVNAISACTAVRAEPAISMKRRSMA